MELRWSRYAPLILGMTLLLLTACATSPPVRFYVLTTVSEAQTTGADTASTSGLALGVGPVTLPPYLDRPQIVTRTTPSQLAIAEFDQWAAPLRDDVARVLGENLAVMVPTERVAIFPWSRSTPIEYEVVVKATRFEAKANGEVVLLARWRLLDEAGNELAMKRSRFTAAGGTQSYEMTVVAMSRVLEALSREIAAVIRALPPQGAAR